jgi:hypothetical protein
MLLLSVAINAGPKYDVRGRVLAMRLPGNDVGRHVRTEPLVTGNGSSPDAADGTEAGYPLQRLQQHQLLVRTAPVQRRFPKPACVASLATYREAVAELLLEVAGQLRPDDLSTTETRLADRLDSPVFAPMLATSPGGPTASIGELLAEVRNYRPGVGKTGFYTADLTAMIRAYLLARIDVMWWGKVRPFATDAELANSADLVDLEVLRPGGMLLFQYRLQAGTLVGRAARAADRRLLPDRVPRTAGVRSAYARPEVVSLLNQLSARFEDLAPPGTPPLWVTSLTRSVDQQRRLRALGYKATLPSSHCAGYAADIEMAWFRRFGAHRTLARLLLERQNAGELNVIDEGQVWHVCVSPPATSALRRDFDAEVGGSGAETGG